MVTTMAHLATLRYAFCRVRPSFGPILSALADQVCGDHGDVRILSYEYEGGVGVTIGDFCSNLGVVLAYAVSIIVANGLRYVDDKDEVGCKNC